MSDRTTTRLNRRRFVQWTSLGVGTVLLAACAAPAPKPEPTIEATEAATVAAPGTAVPPASAGKITLDLWFTDWGEVWNKPMVDFGKKYEDANPNVTLDWTFSAEWQEKLLARVAAGDPPDLTYTNFASEASLASKDTFIPLDEYVAQAGYKREDFVISMWDGSLWNGKLYALPGGSDFLALFYSKTLYKEAGLDPESPPKTTAELVAHSAKILKLDGAGNLERIGWSPTSYDFPNWGFIFGGQWYDAQQGKITANDPKIVEALEWVVDYVKGIGADKLSAWQSSQPDSYSPGNPFATARGAFLLDGYWMGFTLDDLAPDLEYGVTYWPTPNGTPEERRNYFINGWMVAIPRGAKHADQVWQFAKWYFTDNAWRMCCDTVSGITVIAQIPQFKTCVIEEQLKGDNRLAPYINIFTDTGAAATNYWPAIPVNSFYSDEAARAYDFAVRGEKTAKQALDDCTATVQAELDKV